MIPEDRKARSMDAVKDGTELGETILIQSFFFSLQLQGTADSFAFAVCQLMMYKIPSNVRSPMAPGPSL